MIYLGAYLSFLGLVFFSLSLNKHYKLVLKKDSITLIRNLNKILGAVVLTVALFILINTLGLSLGLSYWTGYLGISVLSIGLLYTYKADFIIKLSIVLFILTLIFTFI